MQICLVYYFQYEDQKLMYLKTSIIFIDVLCMEWENNPYYENIVLEDFVNIYFFFTFYEIKQEYGESENSQFV